MTAATAPDFRKLRKETNGLMPAVTYAEYYKVAAEQSKSNVIDIGAGQGATSISYASGIKASGRNSKVYAIDIFWQPTKEGGGPHHFNTTDYPDQQQCIEMNIAYVRGHARRYGVDHLIEFWPGPTEEVAKRFPKDVDFDVLTIDIDGRLDVHLPLFCDIVQPNGLIILDDYGDFIDRHGEAYVAQMKGKTENEIRDWIKQIGPRGARRILGKHLLSFRLVEYFESLGILQREKVVEVTAFCRKTSDKPFRSFDMSGVPAVNRSIEDDFVRLCTAT
jgi:predicted O-methyltransferase YrrM